jgi:hypothetical protein
MRAMVGTPYHRQFVPQSESTRIEAAYYVAHGHGQRARRPKTERQCGCHTRPAAPRINQILDNAYFDGPLKRLSKRFYVWVWRYRLVAISVCSCSDTLMGSTRAPDCVIHA